MTFNASHEGRAASSEACQASLSMVSLEGVGWRPLPCVVLQLAVSNSFQIARYAHRLELPKQLLE